MLSAEATADGVTAVGDLRPSVAVDAVEWEPGVGTETGTLPPSLAEAVDDVVGRATGLQLPVGPVSVVDRETNASTPVTDRESLPSSRYELTVDSVASVSVTFEGRATLVREGEATRVSFPAPTVVRIGFTEQTDVVPEQLTVPQTPEGVAAALSVSATNALTTTAARSHSRMRRRPPTISFGDEIDIPSTLQSASSGGVSLRLPDELDYVVPAASLAYYLDATVDVAPGATPTLSTPNLDYEFDTLPGYQYEVAAMLRRVFLLDCLVREALPGSEQLTESDLLTRLPLDPETVADAPIARRVETYLDVPFDLISPDLPEWHLSMYVKPAYEYVKSIPHIISNVPNLFLPESQQLQSTERLTRSLDDFYRDSDSAQQVDPVKPLLGPGRVHGWLSDGIPIDVFKSLPEAYENRSMKPKTTGPTSVVAVLNDPEMSSEHQDAAEIYRQGTADLDINVSVREDLTRAELAEVFEADHDFVHFIGHCEEGGLQCRDGNFQTTTLDQSGAETFFLNACGSYHQGVELIRKGSVSGAVTFEKVLDGHAARVGTTFVRLLVNGFSIERALNLARRRIIMGTDYTVVGDGTHKLSGAPETVPLVIALSSTDDGDSYRITFDASSPRVTGDVFRLPEPLGGQTRLFGAESEVVLPAAETASFIAGLDVPVIFDGDIQWSTDLAGRLA